MDTQKLMKKIAVITSLAGVIVGLGFGCGLGFQPVGSYSEISSITDPGGLGGGGENTDGITDIRANTVTAGVAMYTTYYSSLLKCMDLNPTVPAQVTQSAPEFGRQKESLSDNGRASSITAPVAFASTILAGAICRDRIVFENAAAANRSFFTSINLAAAPTVNNVNQITQANVDQVVNRIARACWGRNETAAERTTLFTDLTAAMAFDANNNANKTQEAMLFLCSSMLASMSGMQQ